MVAKTGVVWEWSCGVRLHVTPWNGLRCRQGVLELSGVMWGGNQRIDQWMKWWICVADAVGSNLERVGKRLILVLVWSGLCERRVEL